MGRDVYVCERFEGERFDALVRAGERVVSRYWVLELERPGVAGGGGGGDGGATRGRRLPSADLALYSGCFEGLVFAFSGLDKVCGEMFVARW